MLGLKVEQRLMHQRSRASRVSDVIFGFNKTRRKPLKLKHRLRISSLREGMLSQGTCRLEASTI